MNFLQSSFNRQWILTVKTEAEMVLMKYFCFYFPVRLGIIKTTQKKPFDWTLYFRFGVLVTSAVSFLESLMTLIYFTLHDVEYFKNQAKLMQENIEDYSSNSAFDMLLEHFVACK